MKPDVDKTLAHIRDLMSASKMDEASWALRKLRSRHPDHHDVIALAAIFEYRRSNGQGALQLLRQAVARFPGSAKLRTELGQMLTITGNRIAAEQQFRRALELDPKYRDALSWMAQYLIDRLDFDETRSVLQRLLEIDPNASDVWDRIGSCSLAEGQLEEADVALQKAMSLDATNTVAAGNRALLSNYRDDLQPAEVFAIHQQWAQRHAPASAQMRERGERKPGRIRIGFVSPDFKSHSVGMFFEPVLKHLDRSTIEATCYSAVAEADATTERMRAMAEHWRNIRFLTDAAVAEMVRRDDIDILVDLSGFTGSTRLPAFALRPAPIQITWLGYPNTTGMRQMDYRLTDAVADPTEASQAWHSEKLVRLPGTFFCYGGPGIEVAPPIPEPPSVRNPGAITFAVPTSIQKIRPRMIGAWFEILNRVPGSRIRIHMTSAESRRGREFVLNEFARLGITDPSRIEMRQRVLFSDYFATHNDWDVALDTFPFNGHTTTCHCLWMGVPIVTLAGQMHAGRMGASVLHALGLDDCIAQTREQYIDIAVKLAADVARRRELRQTLRDHMKSYAMMDGKSFTASLETVFKHLFAKHTEKHADAR